MRPAWASSASRARRISRITSSRWSTAVMRPSTMCNRSRAFRRSNSVRRRTTTTRWSMNACIDSFKGRTFGCPSKRARLITPKVVSIWVWWYNWFSTTSSTASRFSSKTIRIPSRSLSSRRSVTPSIRFDLTSNAIDSTRAALLTMYGISVITIRTRSWPASS